VRSSETELSALEALAADGLDDDPEAWVELANAYHGHDANDAAAAAVDRALQLDPSSVGALTTMFDLAEKAGDLELMERAARAVATAEPHGHEGCERIGRMLLRRGDLAALESARKAVYMAPYCHNAGLGFGEAQLVAGDLRVARAAAKRAAEISPPEEGDSIAVLLAALSGDPARLERELAAAHGHLPALPFPPYIAALRAACTAGV
jgi:predicted TPR repeat methyltransferase